MNPFVVVGDGVLELSVKRFGEEDHRQIPLRMPRVKDCGFSGQKQRFARPSQSPDALGTVRELHRGFLLIGIERSDFLINSINERALRVRGKISWRRDFRGGIQGRLR